LALVCLPAVADFKYLITPVCSIIIIIIIIIINNNEFHRDAILQNFRAAAMCRATLVPMLLLPVVCVPYDLRNIIMVYIIIMLFRMCKNNRTSYVCCNCRQFIFTAWKWNINGNIMHKP